MSITHELNNWLRNIADSLDLPEELARDAEKKYTELHEWLSQDHEEKYNSDAAIYVQGSMMLGTTVMPVKHGDEVDVDLVYRRDIQRDSITKEDLKKQVGDQLRNYLVYLKQHGRKPPELIEGKRCWTLDYPSRFHMDILPALPDDEADIYNRRNLEDAIIITDKNQREWHHSNPKGYNAWFQEQMRVMLAEKRALMAKQANVTVDKIPEHSVRTPLQRAVQLLKRHRDLRYEGNPDDKPISIIITTLAAHAYQNEADVYEALVGIVDRMPVYIEKRDGVYWVENPVNPEENFADKWEHEERRKDRFYEWLGALKQDLEDALNQQGRGMHKVATVLTESFGPGPVQFAASKIAEEARMNREKGMMKMGVGGVLGGTGKQVRGHGFHGA
jgi:hypothetical protein